MRFQPPRSLEDVPTVEEIVGAADATVAGLDAAKRRLAWIMRRFMVAGVQGAPAPPNLLILGPTGGGKTHLLRAVMERLPVVWTESNLTEFSDVGYVGRDLTTMYAPLIAPHWRGDRKVDAETWTQREMIGHAQRFGVVLLDEFDKLRMTAKPGERQVGMKLQAELLKLVEGTDVEVKRSEQDPGFSIRTHGILHIAMGAFEGLVDTMVRIDNEDDPSRPEPSRGERLTMHLDVDTYDLQRYGFMGELVGRFSTLLPFPALDHAAVQRILTEQVIPRYQRELALHDVRFEVEDGALSWLIGEVMVHGKSGARSITPLMEELTWRHASSATPGSTVVLTASSVSERTAELRTAGLAA